MRMRDVALTRPLVLEIARRVTDGAGGWAETWEPLGVLWADVALRGGANGPASDIDLGRLGLRILVRGAPQGSAQRPAPGQRFRDGARVYAIRAVTEVDATARYLVCLALEEVVR